MSQWPDLILGDDPDALADAFNDCVGCDVDPERFYFHCRDRMIAPGGPGRVGVDWSDGTWLMWIKNRAHEIGGFLCGEIVTEVGFFTELHVGFVSVVETDEHVYHLKKNSEDAPSSSVARSKVFSTNNPIRPVNRVAERVARDDR